MYESVGEYLKHGGDKQLLIRWRDIPKKGNMHGRDTRPHPIRKAMHEFTPELQRRIYKIARKHRYRISKDENVLKVEDLEFLKLPGKFLISEDGMVTEIRRLFFEPKKKYVMLVTDWMIYRLTSTARCMMRHIHEPANKHLNVITTQKIAFFLYFFLTGDLMKAFAMTYRNEYLKVRSMKASVGYIFRHIVNPETILKMKTLLDEDEYKQILRENGANAAAALKSLSDMMSDHDVDADTRLDAIKTTLRLNGFNPDEVKVEKAQQNNFFGSLSGANAPALPALPVKQITGAEIQEVEARPVKIKKKK